MSRPSLALEYFLVRGDIDACRNRLARIHDALNGNIAREAVVRFYFGAFVPASPARAKLEAERAQLLARMADLERQAQDVLAQAHIGRAA